MQDDPNTLLEKRTKVNFILGEEQQIILEQKMLDIDNQYIQETDDAKNLLNYLLEQRKFSTSIKKKYETNCHRIEGITLQFLSCSFSVIPLLVVFGVPFTKIHSTETTPNLHVNKTTFATSCPTILTMLYVSIMWRI